ncbi:unnamed protein product [Alopecurus aequalis]
MIAEQLAGEATTMVVLPRSGPNLLGISLPEEIFVLEILVRLPSKDLVRCRAASPPPATSSWHTTAASPPPLVLLSKHREIRGDLRAFHHRAADGEIRLQPVARIKDSTANSVVASCDGLLLLSVRTFSAFIRRDFICNPTTRQIGCVPEIRDFKVTGLYRHPPTGEYRLLLHMTAQEMFCEDDRAATFLHWVATSCGRGASGVRRSWRASSTHLSLSMDYDSEVWSHEYRVKLPVAEIKEYESRDVMVVHKEEAIFVLYNFEETLFLVDTEGKLLASSQLNASIRLTATHRIKESLVQHSFFSALQGDLNAWSFI